MCKIFQDIRNESREQGMKEGRKEGRREGKKEGKKEGMRETALRMLEVGRYALDEIVNISGLSMEEVKQLKADKSV